MFFVQGLEHLHIDYEEIEIKREIGKGSFAFVYEGVYPQMINRTNTKKEKRRK